MNTSTDVDTDSIDFLDEVGTAATSDAMSLIIDLIYMLENLM